MNDVIAAAAGTVRRIEVVRNTWGHDIPEDREWTAPFDRGYWATVVDRFRPGDRVDIHSADHRIQYSMLILDVNTSSDPIYLDVAFRPIWPIDLALPVLPPQREPRYQVRMAPGSSNWRVVDTSSGKSVHDNEKDRHSALEMAAELERGAAFSAEQNVAVVTVKSTVTPGASRTKKWREKQRGSSRAAASPAAAPLAAHQGE